MGTMNFGRMSYTSPHLELVAFERVGLLKLGPSMLTPRPAFHGEGVTPRFAALLFGMRKLWSRKQNGLKCKSTIR